MSLEAERGKEVPWHLQKECGPAYIFISDFWPPELKESISVALRHQVYGNLLLTALGNYFSLDKILGFGHSFSPRTEVEFNLKVELKSILGVHGEDSNVVLCSLDTILRPSRSIQIQP